MKYLSIIALLTSPVLADNISINYKHPTTKQNVPVEVYEVGVGYKDYTVYLPIYYVNKQVGYGVGLGKQFSTDSKCPRGVLEPKLYYLDTYDYGRKNYGGPVQFAYSVGLECELNRITLGYTFDHISNGSRYDVNPALDAHTIHIKLSID